jgi:hypothetical protein
MFCFLGDYREEAPVQKSDRLKNQEKEVWSEEDNWLPGT